MKKFIIPIILLAILLVSCSTNTKNNSASSKYAKSLIKKNDTPEVKLLKAYSFISPYIMIELTKNQMMKEYNLQFNQIKTAKGLSTYKTRNVVLPNIDTIYSMAFINLDKSPVVIKTPDMKNRFFVLPFLDQWSNVFAVISSRTIKKSGAQRDLMVGPNWKKPIPKGYDHVFRSSTNLVWMLGRTKVKNKYDVKEAYKLINQYKIYSLIKGTDNKANITYNIPKDLDPLQSMLKVSISQYFSLYNKIAKNQKILKPYKVIFDALAKYNIGDGLKFNLNKFNLPNNFDENKFKNKFLYKIKVGSNSIMENKNGWMKFRNKDIGTYNNNIKSRSIISIIGLGVNLPEDAIYSICYVDKDGKKLNGANNVSYLLKFKKGKLPPVNGFWSITLYNTNQYLYKNKYNKYGVRSSDKLVYEKDGSLNIYIQHNRPKGNVNWIPAPTTPFNFTFRTYWPKKSILNGTWNIPAIEKLK